MTKKKNEDPFSEDLNQEIFTFPKDEGMHGMMQHLPNQFVHVQKKENPAYASSTASSTAPLQIQSQFEPRFEGGSHSQLRPSSAQPTALVKV